MRFDGKVAVVTGAASGMGASAARMLAAEGARVFALDLAWPRRPEDPAIAVIDCDIADEFAVQATFARILAEAGTIDLLFNNAGTGRGGMRLHEVRTEDFDRVMAVNIRGMFLVFREAVKAMLGRGGAIVNTASTSSYQAVPMTGAYSSSKGAVLQFTLQAAQEYAEDGIRVNCVCPGATDTGMLSGAPDALRERTIQSIPMKRVASADEIAHVALFLLSDQASYVTGAAYLVDGGKVAMSS